MITPERYDQIPQPFQRLALTLENDLIADISRRIAKTDTLTATALERAAEIRTEATEVNQNYRKLLAETTKKTDEEIDRIFHEAAEETYTYDKRLFDAKGIPFTPYDENEYLQQLTQGIADQTKGTYLNLSQSQGFVGKGGLPLPMRTFYTELLDDAVFNLTVGGMDYNTVIKRSVETMTKGKLIEGVRSGGGLNIVDYASGRRERVESVMRRAILTGVKQIEAKITFSNISALDAEYVYVSGHDGARPDHQVWQSRVYSLNNFKL